MKLKVLIKGLEDFRDNSGSGIDFDKKYIINSEESRALALIIEMLKDCS